jgi:hypothetical protein
MTFDAERLYDLLPAIYRIRDAEQGGPLRELLAVIAEQVGVLEQDLDQLYDDQFVETCAGWVVPYLGDLIGVRGLQGAGAGQVNPRAEVGNTIGYRRRKGTAAVLEQLAHDVTGWPARAVEFFQVLATTQYLNHLRPENCSFLPVRGAARLEHLGGPFEHLAGEADLAHTADVRRVAGGRGRYNVPNVGLFLWRLRAYSLTGSPAVPAAAGERRRFLFSPLGVSAPLFNAPLTEDEFTHLAEPVNLPGRISRRVLSRDLADYYGRAVLIDGVPADQVRVCDLSDHNGTWAHLPEEGVALDPVLGRVAFAADRDAPLVTFHYGFSADMGGGEYDRASPPDPPETLVVRVPDEAPTLGQALAALGPSGGVVEITDSGRHGLPQPPALDLTGRRLTVRAGDKRRPTLVLGGPWTAEGEAGELTLDGLLLTGDPLSPQDLADAPLRTGAGLARLRLRHCTLVPGVTLNADGGPRQASTPSLVVEGTTLVEIDHCVVGGLRAGPDARVRVAGSIVDATAEAGVAYAAPADDGPGGPLRLVNCTVIGKVHADLLELASNTIFLAALAGADPWPAPVRARRRQQGCVRFCYVPPGSRVPRRFRCLPAAEADAARVRPVLSSARYGRPEYGQLSPHCAPEVRRGGDDEAEMGAFHDLYQPQREAHLRARLEEYLRFGLEAGVFFAT